MRRTETVVWIFILVAAVIFAGSRISAARNAQSRPSTPALQQKHRPSRGKPSRAPRGGYYAALPSSVNPA
jgi:hypothetical protein